MTDQTVPVPIAVLQRLRAGFLDERPVEGTITARREAVLEVLDYIPSPPKVGDVLTVDQIKELPANAVLRDSDDDVWITTTSGVVLAMVTGGHLSADDGEPIDMYMYLSPFVLVSLPRD